MNRVLNHLALSVVVLTALCLAPREAAAQSCTHMAGAVVCPAGITPGSSSVSISGPSILWSDGNVSDVATCCAPFAGGGSFSGGAGPGTAMGLIELSGPPPSLPGFLSPGSSAGGGSGWQPGMPVDINLDPTVLAHEFGEGTHVPAGGITWEPTQKDMQARKARESKPSGGSVADDLRGSTRASRAETGWTEKFTKDLHQKYVRGDLDSGFMQTLLRVLGDNRPDGRGRDDGEVKKPRPEPDASATSGARDGRGSAIKIETVMSPGSPRLSMRYDLGAMDDAANAGDNVDSVASDLNKIVVFD